MANAKQIGEVIRQARKSKKITQRELGARIGLAGDAKTAISAYEKGTTKVIPFARRAKMANILNIPMSQLLYDNEEPEEKVTMRKPTKGLESGMYHCSRCGGSVHPEGKILLYKFCSHCGREIEGWMIVL